MRDAFNMFFNFGNHNKRVYNLVSTNETFSNSTSPYSATTTTINDDTEANPYIESLSAIAVIDRILFKGKLSQGEDKIKCK